MGHNALMSEKKRKGDRHKPSRMVRVREALAEVLDRLAEQNASDITEEVNRAVREMLQREGWWPRRDCHQKDQPPPA